MSESLTYVLEANLKKQKELEEVEKQLAKQKRELNVCSAKLEKAKSTKKKLKCQAASETFQAKRS